MEGGFSKIPPLSQKTIHFWHFPISPVFFDHSFPEAILSKDEIQKGKQFKFEKDRRAFWGGRGILRYLLSYYTSVPPDELKFQYNAFGKPFLSNNKLPFSVVFNLSHSIDSIILAFAKDRALGIDIESFNQFAGWKDIVNAFFLEEEKEYLYHLKPAEQLRCFFQIWTKKEALLKALGVGLGMGLERLPKTPLIGQKVIHITEKDFSSSTWVIRELSLSQGYNGAIAYQGEDISFGSFQSSFNKTISALPIGLFSSI